MLVRHRHGIPATTAYAIHADLDVAGTFKWIKGFVASNLPAKQGAMLAGMLEEANAEVPSRTSSTADVS